MNDIHDLLPWYANRTLGREETAAFESHLPGCEECRKELAVLEKIQARLEDRGEALLSDHPSPQVLVAALMEEPADSDLKPGQSEEVRRHIALCVACADEASWVMRESAAGAAPAEAPIQAAGRVAPPATTWRPPSWVWAVAAALLLLVALPVVFRLGGGRTGIVKPSLVEATERADGATVVGVAPGAEMIYLIFPVDLAPGALPAAFEVLDAGGTVIHRDEAVESDDLYRGLFVFLGLRREDCPDGEYMARLIPAGGTATEYPFEVITGSRRP